MPREDREKHDLPGHLQTCDLECAKRTAIGKDLCPIEVAGCVAGQEQADAH
jgi:hypothetical protein